MCFVIEDVGARVETKHRPIPTINKHIGLENFIPNIPDKFFTLRQGVVLGWEVVLGTLIRLSAETVEFHPPPTSYGRLHRLVIVMRSTCLGEMASDYRLCES